MSSYIPGLASGFDWSSMITQLMEAERKPEQLLEANKSVLSDKKDVWKAMNTKLLSLRTAAQSLSSLEDFDLYTSSTSISGTTGDVADFASFTVGSSASQGSYALKIDNLAQAQKLGTRSFDSQSDELGITGDLVINGRTLSITATDGLTDIKNKINKLNSGSNPAGVTASISTVGTNEYRLTLTAKSTGAAGMAITNGSSADVLGSLGLADDTTTIRNAITGGAQSLQLTDSTESIKSLLGLNSAASGSVTIAGQAVAIDLENDSLQDIRDTINANAALNAQRVSASIVSEEKSGTTYYRLQIDGTQALTDSGNILDTLGFLKRGTADVSGVTGGTANTADGQKITGDTLISAIDGYNTQTAGDKITISGTRHGGAAVNTDFTIDSTSTVNDLLNAIKSAYSNEVNAYVDGNGKIVVEDSMSGASQLGLSLTESIGDASSSLDFGVFNSSTIRKRQLTAGEDAQITLDGSTIKRSTNQLTDVIQGVTINLLKEDADAEITLDINRNTEGIKKNITAFVDSYNAIIDAVNDQFKYTSKQDSSTGKTVVSTPPLFGDAALLSMRSSLKDAVLSGVSGIDSSMNHLSAFGIELDKTGNLTIDETKLDGYLQTNLDDLVNLFSAQGSSTNSYLTYVGSTESTQSGSYEVKVDQYATKATTSGTGFGGTLSAPTTIAITDDSGKTATISLSAGWNMASIVSAINSELPKEYNETRVGANRYYADNTQGSAITDATKLDSLYNGSGTSANLASGDEIHFTGMDRDGLMINSTFTLTDPSTQTVGDFISFIESQYGDGYDAYVDTSGRVAIKDTTVGSSSLLLTIDPVKDLDFGAIDVDPTGADGSQTGRTGLAIVAENDGGQLKISNADFGGSHFDITVTGGNLGITNGTYTGQDVMGSIRKVGSTEWMTMTGSGTSLTVDDDQDASGLEVSFTGTSTGTFDFTFTTGVGEKLDRTLYSMTDIGGYIVSKEESLQNQMDNIDKKIDAMELRLTKRQEQLMAQYSNMETLLSRLKAQQDQLTSQISGLSS